MELLASARQMKEIDRLAIEERGIPSTTLMERAARGLLRELAPVEGKRAVIFAGPGNNGGDGVALAGLLRKEGWQVRCFLAGDRAKMTDDCREMERRLAELGGVLEQYDPDSEEQKYAARRADAVVDALFGVGLHSPLREPAADAVRLINSCPGLVVSATSPPAWRRIPAASWGTRWRRT